MPLQIPSQTIAEVPLNPHVDPMTRISGMLGIQNQRIANEGNQKVLDEQNALRDLVNNPTVQNPDGSLNQDKFTAQAQVVAPTQGAKIAQGNLSNQTTQIANSTSQYHLIGEQAQKARDIVTGLIQDPSITGATDPEKMSNPAYAADISKKQMQLFLNAKESMINSGIPKINAESIFTPFYQAAEHHPKFTQQILANTIQQGQGAQGQAAQSLVPAGSQNSVGTDSQGRPIITPKTQFGGVAPITGAPVQGQAKVTSTPPQVLPQGETNDTLALMNSERAAVNNSASQVPINHFNNKKIIELASDPGFLSATGKGAQGISDFLGRVGVPASSDYATNLNKLSHYIAVQNQANESAMGVKTDAGRQTAALATGSIEMTPKALISATKVNEANASGLDAFNTGMENAIKNNDNSVFAKRNFQNKWIRVYTPEVMMLDNAIKNKDQDEAARIVKQAGGAGSDGATTLAARARAIHSLITTGDLPK